MDESWTPHQNRNRATTAWRGWTSERLGDIRVANYICLYWIGTKIDKPNAILPRSITPPLCNLQFSTIQRLYWQMRQRLHLGVPYDYDCYKWMWQFERTQLSYINLCIEDMKATMIERSAVFHCCSTPYIRSTSTALHWLPPWQSIGLLGDTISCCQ